LVSWRPTEQLGSGKLLTCLLVVENGIVGEALIALKHEELKEMGITSVGHRLTILKSVYETKVKQDIPLDPDHYIPLCRFFLNLFYADVVF
jgi:hypothetical protein